MFIIDEKRQPLGKMSYDQAMWLSFQRGFDLVEIGHNSNPPVCKFVDYNKELYEKAKQARKQKARQKAPVVKEVKLTYNISPHDLDVRVRKAQSFFDGGDKVKVFLILKGRQNIFRERAFELIAKFKELVNAEYEMPIKRQGNNYSALLRRK